MEKRYRLQLALFKTNEFFKTLPGFVAISASVALAAFLSLSNRGSLWPLAALALEVLLVALVLPLASALVDTDYSLLSDENLREYAAVLAKKGKPLHEGNRLRMAACLLEIRLRRLELDAFTLKTLREKWRSCPQKFDIMR